MWTSHSSGSRRSGSTRSTSSFGQETVLGTCCSWPDADAARGALGHQTPGASVTSHIASRHYTSSRVEAVLCACPLCVACADRHRHDIDRDIPRTPKEIFSSNRMMAQKMIDVFGKNFPIVPTLGNNDIWPHNIIQPGPNRITEEFLKCVTTIACRCTNSRPESGSTGSPRTTAMSLSVAPTLL